MQKDASRVPVHLKLLEIYAKRKDQKAFEQTALKVKEVSYVHAEGFAAGELKHGATILLESMWREDRDAGIARSYAETTAQLAADGYRVIEVPMDPKEAARNGKN